MQSWTKKAEHHFKCARAAMGSANYHLSELRDELRYRPAHKDAQDLKIQVQQKMNSIAKELWKFYKKHEPERYAKHFPLGGQADWEQ